MIMNRLWSLSLNEINDDETQIHETLITINISQQLEAKMIELNQWRNEQGYDEKDDFSQQCISIRWVMKEKLSTKRESSKLVYVQEVSKRNRI